MKKEKLFTALFVVISLGYLLGLQADIDALKFLFKPLITIALMLMYVNLVKAKNNTYIAALFFSLVGDTMLLYSSEFTFIIGLISFLLTHILIIVILFKEFKLTEVKHKLMAIVPLFILFYALIDFLKDDLNSLFYPVVVYGLTISFFGIIALANYLQNKSKANRTLLFGAVLFIISDSLLAVDKFSVKTTFLPLLVIVTYMAAQYLICKYMIKKEE